VTGWRSAASALALAAAACTVQPSPVPTPPASSSVTASATPVAAATLGPRLPRKQLSLGNVGEFDAGTLRSASIRINGQTIYWSGDLAEAPNTGVINGYSITEGRSRTVYRAPNGRAVQNLQVSATWFAWFEFADRFRALDTQVFAMPRAGGAPILVDDARSHGELALLQDLTLSGDDLYWTIPEIVAGTWRGRLAHVRLPSLVADHPLPVLSGAIYGWPHASNGNLTVEQMRQNQRPTSVVLFGTPSVSLPFAPASEPAVAGDFIAFKAAERFTAGRLGLYFIRSNRIVELGPGESPSVNSRYVTWFAGQPEDNEIHVADSLKLCVATITRNGSRNDELEYSPAIGDRYVAWLYVDGRPAEARAVIRFASLPEALC